MAAWLPIAFVLSTASTPVEAALDATEPPASLRAAFTLVVESEGARRVLSYDPRKPDAVRWRLEEARGENGNLDALIAEWQADASPDAILFADDLRERMGQSVTVRDMGAAWALDFRPRDVGRDSALDVAAQERMQGTAWLDPKSGRMIRVEYTTPESFSAPQGGRITRLDQSFVLSYDAEYDVSFISAFHLDIAGRVGPVSKSQMVDVRLIELDLFFATTEAEENWKVARSDLLGQSGRRP